MPPCSHLLLPHFEAGASLVSLNGKGCTSSTEGFKPLGDFFTLKSKSCRLYIVGRKSDWINDKNFMEAKIVCSAHLIKTMPQTGLPRLILKTSQHVQWSEFVIKLGGELLLIFLCPLFQQQYKGINRWEHCGCCSPVIPCACALRESSDSERSPVSHKDSLHSPPTERWALSPEGIRSEIQGVYLSKRGRGKHLV